MFVAKGHFLPVVRYVVVISFVILAARFQLYLYSNIHPLHDSLVALSFLK